MIHGQPFQMAPEGQERFEIWAKFAARKGGVKGKMVRLSASYVDKNAAEIKALIQRWIGLREYMREGLGLMDWDEDRA